MAACYTCKAPVLWRRHERTGILAPIDAEPTKDGNIVIIDADTYRMLAKDQGSGGLPRHMNHWATCKRPPGRR